jgi:hypothetical protein
VVDIDAQPDGHLLLARNVEASVALGAARPTPRLAGSLSPAGRRVETRKAALALFGAVARKTAWTASDPAPKVAALKSQNGVGS